MRRFVSSAFVLAAVSGLAGCYDLSADSGPHRDDFARPPTGAAPQDPGKSEPPCTAAPCTANTSTAIEGVVARAVQLPRPDDALDDATRPAIGGRVPTTEP